jgi:excinuclease UvrABC helicase subunit UvrB
VCSSDLGFAKKYGLGAGSWNSTDSVLDNISQPEWVIAATDVKTGVDGPTETIDDRFKLISRLEKEMKNAAARLDFERAAKLRDRIFQLENPQ